MLLIFDAHTGTLNEVEKIMKSDEEWRNLLSEESFRVARKAGTEPAFSGTYHDFHGQGDLPVCLLRHRPLQF